jgi:hypothetical protein
MAKRLGEPHIRDNITALRTVNPGDIHEAGCLQFGIYTGAQQVLAGGKISLDVNATVLVPAGLYALVAEGGLANYNLTTQALVLSGGSDIGRFVIAKILNATTGVVCLNTFGKPA